MATSRSTGRPRGRPIDSGKRAAVLAAAQRLFLSSGFAGTSMDAVAEAAGVSKLTAYKYFGSKQELFATAVAAKCESAFIDIDVGHLADQDFRGCLIGFGRAFLALILDPGAMAVHHLVIVERERAPELGRLFFENAVRPTGDKLATIIARHEEGGEISTGNDPLAAAQDLLSLWRGRPAMLLDLTGGEVDPEAMAQHVTHCVDLCLRAWAPGEQGETR